MDLIIQALKLAASLASLAAAVLKALIVARGYARSDEDRRR